MRIYLSGFGVANLVRHAQAAVLCLTKAGGAIPLNATEVGVFPSAARPKNTLVTRYSAQRNNSPESVKK